MPNEYMVVGEHRADSQRLLVQGSDGRYYSYHPRRGRMRRVEVDDQWVRHVPDDGGDNVSSPSDPAGKPPES
jgi:hypothetical protein